jgi:HAMP domain-containing protein
MRVLILVCTIGLLAGCASDKFLKAEIDRSTRVAEACSAIEATASEANPAEILSIRLGLENRTDAMLQKGRTLASLSTNYPEFRITLNSLKAKYAASDQRIKSAGDNAAASIDKLTESLRVLRAELRRAFDLASETELKKVCRTPRQCISNLASTAQRAELLVGTKYHETLGALDEVNEAATRFLRIVQETQVLDKESMKQIESIAKQFQTADTVLRYFKENLENPFGITEADVKDWEDVARVYLEARARQKTASLILGGLNRSVESVERLASKIDEKTWFFAELALWSSSDMVASAVETRLKEFITSTSMDSSGKQVEQVYAKERLIKSV